MMMLIMSLVLGISTVLISLSWIIGPFGKNLAKNWHPIWPAVTGVLFGAGSLGIITVALYFLSGAFTW